MSSDDKRNSDDTAEEEPTTSPPNAKRARTNADVVLDVFGDDDDDDENDESIEYDEEALYSRSIIREATIPLPQTNSGTYTFHIQLFHLTGDPEDEADDSNVCEIETKLYFQSDEKASTTDSAEQVGYLSAFWVPRSPTSSMSFYELAAAVSEELAELAVLFGNSQGHITKVNTGLSEEEIETGGLVHIYAMEVKGPGHAGRCDLGLHLVHNTLTFLQSSENGSHNWTITVMVPCLLGVQSQKWPEFHNRLMIDPSAAEHSVAQTEGLEQAHLDIKRHFARMGFVQAGRNSEQHHAWYLTASTYYGTVTNDDEKKPASTNTTKQEQLDQAIQRWKTKEEVKDLGIFVAPKKHIPEGADAELHALAVEETRDLTKIRAAVKTMKASIHGSRALFVAAAHDDVTLLRVLGEELGGDVNAKDENDNTPLHVAALMIAPEAIAYLLGKGADKKAINDKGHTPLQTAQESIDLLDDGGNPDNIHDEEERNNQRKCLELLQI